jgi:hypothetical protein
MTPLAWRNYPVAGMPGNITGNFGDDYGGYLHRGTDVGVYNVPVLAPAEGRAVQMVNDGSFGIAVCLEHPGTGWFSLYAHLTRNDTYLGQWVQAGQQVGISGNTGMSSGPHLHWQVCDSPSFPVDISHSRDPMAVPFVEEDMGMTPQETDWVQSIGNKVKVLEVIVAENGIDTDGDGKVDLTGPDAVAWAYERGWSAFALGQGTDHRIAVHEADHPGGGGDGLTQDEVNETIAEVFRDVADSLDPPGLEDL